MSAPFAYGPPGAPQYRGGPPVQSGTQPPVGMVPGPVNPQPHQFLMARLRPASSTSEFVRNSVIVPNALKMTSALPLQHYNLQSGVHNNSNYNVTFGSGGTNAPPHPPPVRPLPRTSFIYAVSPPSPASTSKIRTPIQASEDMASTSLKTTGHHRRKGAPTHNKHSNAGQPNFITVARQIINSNGSPEVQEFYKKMGAPCTDVEMGQMQPKTELKYQHDHGQPTTDLSRGLPTPITTTSMPKLERFPSSNISELFQMESNPHFQDPPPGITRHSAIKNEVDLSVDSSSPSGVHKSSPPRPSSSKASFFGTQRNEVYNSNTSPANMIPAQRNQCHEADMASLLCSIAPLNTLPTKPQAMQAPKPIQLGTVGTLSNCSGSNLHGPGPIDIVNRNIKNKLNMPNQRSGDTAEEANRKSRSASRIHGSNEPGCDTFKFSTPGSTTTTTTEFSDSALETHTRASGDINSSFALDLSTHDLTKTNAPFLATFHKDRQSTSESNSKEAAGEPQPLGTKRRATAPKPSFKPKFNVKATRDEKKLTFSKSDVSDSDRDSKFVSFKTKFQEARSFSPKPRRSGKQHNGANENMGKLYRSRNLQYLSRLTLTSSGVGGPYIFPRGECKDGTVDRRKPYDVDTTTGKIKLKSIDGRHGLGSTFGFGHSRHDVSENNSVEAMGELHQRSTECRSKKPRKNQRKSVKDGVDSILKENTSLLAGLSVDSGDSRPEPVKPQAGTSTKPRNGYGSRWMYTSTERNALYKHNAFLIKRADLDFHGPLESLDGHYCIYRLIMQNELTLLQQYIPVEDEEQNRIFHYSTNKCLRIDKIDQGFFEKYQPVYFGVCVGTTEDPNIIHVMWRKKIMQTLCLVFELNPLLGDFLNLLEIMCCQVLNASEIERVLKKDDSDPYKQSFLQLTKKIEDLTETIFSNSRWNQDSLEMVKPWPKLWMGNKMTKMRKEMMQGQLPCEICVPAAAATSVPRSFVKQATVAGIPYDRVHHNPLGVFWTVPEPLKACTLCAELLTSAHRLYHLKNDIFGCILAICNDRLKTDPQLGGDELKEIILTHDMGHWSREMFLDFSIVMADGQKALQKMEKEANVSVPRRKNKPSLPSS